jgi:glutaconate CoA-transferase subunit A
VIITAERIAEPGELEQRPELQKIPGFLVSAVVPAPRGAWPGSCHPLYDYDPAAVRDYLARSGDAESLAAYLEETAVRERGLAPVGGA